MRKLLVGWGLVVTALTAQVAAQFDMAAIQKWGAAKVVHYQIAGAYHAQTSLALGKMAAHAFIDVTDSVTVEFDWDVRANAEPDSRGRQEVVHVEGAGLELDLHAIHRQVATLQGVRRETAVSFGCTHSCGVLERYAGERSSAINTSPVTFVNLRLTALYGDGVNHETVECQTAEPGTLMLLATGASVLGWRARRRT